MISRTPIRLTPHRGPLATPSASPESSPTLSTPPTDIPHLSTPIRPTLDVALLQQRISTLSPSTSHPSPSRFGRRRRKVSGHGLFSCSTELDLMFENLVYSACDLANTVAGIVTFCLLIWGLLEWSSYASELPQPRNPRLLMPQFPLPFPPRAQHRHVNPSLCEPGDQHIAVLQFLSEQIQHAKALSSLSINLGSPLRAFLESHRAIIPRMTVWGNLSELRRPEEVNVLANLTELLDHSLLDLTSGSFIGRSFALALDELGNLITKPGYGCSAPHGSHSNARLHAIYWRTTSNLLLEYSAARPRARILLQRVRALHRQFLPVASGQYAIENIAEASNTWWRKGISRYSSGMSEDWMQAFVAGLEVTLENVRGLVAYLDWITEHLSQTALTDVPKIHHRTDFPSCVMSLQELFAQSRPLAPKRLCFCLDDYTPPSRPEKVDIIIPGSPTVRAGR